MSTLHYGAGCQLTLDVPADALLADCHAPPGIAADSVRGAVRAALAQPINFPPLAQAVVSGDRVVLALEPAIPMAPQVVAAIIEYLGEAGPADLQFTILRTRADVEAGAPDPRNGLPRPMRDKVQLVTHNPDDRGELSYLAATPKGRPIYLSRTLCEADLCLPIGCLRCDKAVNYHGVYGGLYPTFSDAKTLLRFRHPGAADAENEIHEKAQREVNNVGWLAGAPFAIEILPGAAESVLQILAGDPAEVARVGRQRSNEAWSHRVPQRASLVVCGIAGAPEQQTWENVGRALAAALRVVTDDGAIALCTGLKARPGPAIQALVAADDLRSVLRRIHKERPVDTVPAAELAEALGRTRLYLLSDLDETLVEELGIAPVSEPDEIVRLARRHPSCIVLADAQYVVATPIEDGSG